MSIIIVAAEYNLCTFFFNRGFMFRGLLLRVFIDLLYFGVAAVISLLSLLFSRFIIRRMFCSLTVIAD